LACLSTQLRRPLRRGLRFRTELGHGRVGIALLGAVELGDFREMNFGDPNLVIAASALDSLLKRLANVPTPAGPTPLELSDGPATASEAAD
jgi:hypothetical protein